METIQLKGSHFLGIKELMVILGKDISSHAQYESTRRLHKAIRDSIELDKRKLTVKEYCDYEKTPYSELVVVLNRIR